MNNCKGGLLLGGLMKLWTYIRKKENKKRNEKGLGIEGGEDAMVQQA